MQAGTTTAGCAWFPKPSDTDFVFVHLDKNCKRQAQSRVFWPALLEDQRLKAAGFLSFDFVFVQATLAYLDRSAK
jgi:hypothetical protein